MIATAIRQLGGTFMENSTQPLSSAQVLMVTAVAIGLVLLVFLVNQWIWNNVLAKYVTVVNPIPSLWEFILLSYLIMSFHRNM